MSPFGSDRPVLMSRKAFAASATVAFCAAFSLLSGVVYVGCSSSSRPSHLPPPGASSTSNDPSAPQAPTSPSDPSAPTTNLPVPEQLPSTPAPTAVLAQPVTVQAVTVSEAMGSDDVEALAALALDPTSPVEVRYTALRRLEQLDPQRAADVAVELVNDPAELVGVNALAVLVRSGDPRAGAIISTLDADRQQLAAALASQG